ncbi:hypothetical protein [Prescottella soli]
MAILATHLGNHQIARSYNSAGYFLGFGPMTSRLALKPKLDAKAEGGEYSMIQAVINHINEV